MNSTSIRPWYILASLSIGLFAFGCGGSTPPAEGAHGHGEHGEHGEHKHGEHGEHGDHPKMTAEVSAMHDVLAPLWHAEKSPERENKTCEAVPTFEERAGAIDKTVPESARANEAGYHAAAQGLITSVGALKAECAKPAGGRADFDAKFKDMHEAFHKVMDSSRPHP